MDVPAGAVIVSGALSGLTVISVEELRELGTVLNTSALACGLAEAVWLAARPPLRRHPGAHRLGGHRGEEEAGGFITGRIAPACRRHHPSRALVIDAARRRRGF